MRTFCTLLVAVAAVGVARCARAETTAPPVDGIQAVVHDSIVTKVELQETTSDAREQLARQYRDVLLVPDQKLATVLNEGLERLIERQLILQDFRYRFREKQRLAYVNKELDKDVESDLADEIRSRYGGDRMAFVRTLQAQGVTLEHHRQRIRDRIILRWLRAQNVAAEIIVSPHRVEAYYLAHRDEFKLQEEVKLRMIVWRCTGERGPAQTERLAQDVLKKLNEGATFVEMATIHHEGSQRSEGGDLGWNEISKLPKYYADPAASLQQGQHSGVMSRSGDIEDYWVCQYNDGQATAGRHYVARPVYEADRVLKKETLAEERQFDSAAAVTNLPPPVEFYLLLVEDKRPARFKTLAEVRDKIEQDLRAEESSRLEKQWVDGLKKKTFIRVF